MVGIDPLSLTTSLPSAEMSVTDTSAAAALALDVALPSVMVMSSGVDVPIPAAEKTMSPPGTSVAVAVGIRT